jgi:hypothetical protein
MADFFSLRPNFYDDLAELFCQELATLIDQQVSRTSNKIKKVLQRQDDVLGI